VSAVQTSMVEAALAWAADGWAVHPLHPGTKEPILGGWQDEATNNPDQIRMWWVAWPDANIGGAMRRADGAVLVAVDIDVRDGKPGLETMERIEQEFGDALPTTRTHRTSSGGSHHIYRVPPDWDLRSRAPIHPDYPGLDIKTWVGYVVLPPSHTVEGEHSSEGDYTVERDAPIWTCPDWVRELHQRTRSSAVLPGKRGKSGYRDNELTALAGLMARKGADEQEIFKALMAHDGAFPMPLGEAACRRIARGARRWGPDALNGLPDRDTDQANAKLLLHVAEGGIVFRYDDKAFSLWDDWRWVPASWSGELTLRAIDWLNRSGKHERARKLEFTRAQTGMWEAIKNEPGVSRTNEEFDANPYLFNVRNGTLDLRTGTLLDHDPDRLLTKLAGCDYDPNADMAEWEAFVLWCCCGDAEQANWLRVTLGQALIGQVDEHILAFLFGSGRNGKTQFLTAIQRTMGGYSIESGAELLTAKGPDKLHTEVTASLDGVRLAICPEPDKGSHWNAGRAKHLTGGDPISSRHLYGREFTFRPSHTLVVHGNWQPEIRDHSTAFKERLKLVPFTNWKPPNERIKRYGEHLAGPAVLRWLVSGAREYAQTQDLPTCASIARATEEYFRGQNPLVRFGDDECDFSPEKWSSTEDIYLMYTLWCKRTGQQYIETMEAFIPMFVKHYSLAYRRRRLGGDGQRRGLQGVGLSRVHPSQGTPVY
jgi:putative DNA primase/helicase